MFTRQGVTERIISSNTMPYVVPAGENSTTCCMLLVPNFYFVTACRIILIDITSIL
ncbi:hypothetical protein KKE26_10425 [bacterium]|nr:hypothetical protein [bacterium]MBU1754379.1 hypothetical protein [bacterium]